MNVSTHEIRGKALSKSSIRLLLSICLIILIAGACSIFVINWQMKTYARDEAKEKALMMLDRNLAIHTYFSHQLKPDLFKELKPIMADNYFDPVWMSSTYAVRGIDQYYRALAKKDYYYKECAINARSPENEADPFERAFIEKLNKTPGLTEESDVRVINGKPYFVVLRRGETMEQSCLRCHSTPAAAPANLLARYGSVRSFDRWVGEVVSAVSIRIPLGIAYAKVDKLILHLSVFLCMTLLIVLGLAAYLSKQWVFKPLNTILLNATEISKDPNLLGKQIDLPSSYELSELTKAFNVMSFQLRKERDRLEYRVKERTKDLKQTRDMLQAVLDAAPAGIVVADAAGNILLTSAATQHIFGNTVTDDANGPEGGYHVSTPDGSPAPPGQLPLSLPLSGQTVTDKEILITRSDGKEAIILASATPLKTDKGDTWGAVTAFKDITERKRGEEALRESEQRVRRKLESVLSPTGDLGELELADLIDAPAIQKLMEDFYAVARIPMSIIDVRGRVLVAVGWQDICTHFHRVHSDTCRNCLESSTHLSSGLAKGEYRLYKCKNNLWDMATPIIVAGQQMGNIFSGQFFFDDETVDRELFRAQARKYGFDEMEYLAALDRVPRLSRETVDRGTAFFLKLSDMVSQLGYSNVKLARLLAERDRLTDSLRESRSKLEAALASMTDAVFISDAKGRFIDFNDAFATFHRFRNKDECSKTFAEYPDILDVFQHDGTPAPLDMWAVPRALRGETVTNAEYTLRRKDTGETWVGSYSFGPIRDKDGVIIGSVVVGRDITEHKRAQEALQQSNKELEQFAYVASHDLQEPLRAVVGFLQLIQSRYGDQIDEKGRHFIERSVQAGNRMQRLIRELLTLSRVNTKGEAFAPTDLNHIVKNALENLQTIIREKNLDITCAALPVLTVDASQIQRLFQNLIMNAVKYNQSPKPVIDIDCRERDDVYQFFVKDNGIGISPEFHQRIFMLFQRLHTESEYPGTGLGLALCKKIIERHGGKIWVESQGEKGSTFNFTLPKRMRGSR
jgi:PAS domain S-box-containing protein